MVSVLNVATAASVVIEATVVHVESVATAVSIKREMNRRIR